MNGHSLENIVQCISVDFSPENITKSLLYIYKLAN